MSHLDPRDLPADSAKTSNPNPFDGGLFTDTPFVVPAKPLPATRRIAAALQEQRDRLEGRSAVVRIEGAAGRNAERPQILDEGTGELLRPGIDVSPYSSIEETRLALRRAGGERSRATDAEVGRAFRRLTPEPGLPGQTPSSNTGFDTSNESEGDSQSDRHENRILVDYLAVTFKGQDALFRAMAFYGPTESCWTETGRGAMGFTNSKKRGEVTLFYGGDRMADTVHVQARGMGCRQLEGEGYINGTGMLDGKMGHWQAHFNDLLSAGATFSRLDFAVDEFEGRINIDTIIEYKRNKDITATFGRGKSKDPWFNVNVGIDNNGLDCGKTVNLGKSSSNMFIRIYHKGAEQFVKGKEETILDWVRVEAQTRNEKADKLAAAIVQFGVTAVASVLWAAIDFKDPDDKEELEKNSWRRKTVAWWAEWLDATSKLRLQMGTPPKTVETVKTWLEAQVAAALHVVYHAVGGGRDYIDHLIWLGGQKLNSRHIAMLVADREQKETVHDEIDRACTSRRSIGLYPA